MTTLPSTPPSTTPLSILDLSPIPSGSTARDALRNTIDLARRAEASGYHRYWLAEHHLAPGVAGSAPQIGIALVAAATERIRVGSGSVQAGHWTPLAIVEQFGTIDALHPGRIDLGLGRSGQRRSESVQRTAPAPPPPREPRVVDGLLIPRPFNPGNLASLPNVRLMASLLQQPGAETPDFAEQVDQIIGLINGSAPVTPGRDADLEIWITGSSAGQSARVAGERGLPFAASYHISPGTALDAVDAYREAFKPSDVLDEPYVMVSADVLVAPDEETANHLAAPFAVWVHSIRTSVSAVPYPTPEEAAAFQWTDEARALVEDRTSTRFVGTPETVAERLRVLQRVTGADELLVTTITHSHADRVRSHELLAQTWQTAQPG